MGGGDSEMEEMDGGREIEERVREAERRAGRAERREGEAERRAEERVREVEEQCSRREQEVESRLEEMEERVLANPRITSWKQLRADYLPHVSGRYHTRLLAMTRLGILPIEIETGRWEGVDRSERFCKFEACNGKLGDACHFLSECAGLKTKGIASVWRCPSGSTPGVWWRETAHQLEPRWREKSLARNITTASDFHFQADLGDAWNCEFDEHVPRPTFLDPGSAPPDDLAAEIFTDGSKKTDVMHAGWGMWGVLLNAMGDVTQIIEVKGHVPTGSDDTEYLGAERGTNMTGELTKRCRRYRTQYPAAREFCFVLIALLHLC